jgi:protein O-GlcNAc transferase
MGTVSSQHADYIQYTILDKELLPKSIREQFSENIIHLPIPAFATPHFSDSIPKCTKEEYYLPKDKFIFCCLSESYRIQPRVFDTWLKILEQAPDSILWLRSDHSNIRENLTLYAKEHGIDKSRLVFTSETVLSQTWHHQLADLWLDTPFVSGSTEVFLSLWAHLPILSLAGDTPQARLATSALTACNLKELISTSLEEYIEKALYYYNNREKLASIKEKITLNKTSYPVFSPKQLATNLETAFENIWEQHLTNKSLTDLYI